MKTTDRAKTTPTLFSALDQGMSPGRNLKGVITPTPVLLTTRQPVVERYRTGGIPCASRLPSFFLPFLIGALVWSGLRAPDASFAAGEISPTGGVLAPAQQKRVDQAVERALAYIASQQKPDGSFCTYPTGESGVTALCVLAYLSCGYLPGEGLYAKNIEAGIDYVISCQQESGLISLMPPAPYWDYNNSAHTGTYNHAVSGLLLCEVYGMVGEEQCWRIPGVVKKALEFSRGRQTVRKTNRLDDGAWRYLAPRLGVDADLSITSWQLMFWRSAKNAGFEVPSQWVDEAMEYVRRCYNEQEQVFYYTIHGQDYVYSRGMTGAGILTLALAGLHDTAMARNAGNWVLRHPFDRPRPTEHGYDRFYYAAFYCSQAMYQLGGNYWEQFYPTLANTLVSNQRSGGSWDSSIEMDDEYGDVYVTAISVLSLTPENQLLPIFQR
jgi:hypothetical protein